jgi:hypothetical protein
VTSEYEEKKVDKKENKGIEVRQAIDVKKKIVNPSGFNLGDSIPKKRDFDDSKASLLKETLGQMNGKINPISDGAGNKQGTIMDSDSDDDQDEDKKFFELFDLPENIEKN